MSLDPQERLEELRREVLAERPPAAYPPSTTPALADEPADALADESADAPAAQPPTPAASTPTPVPRPAPIAPPSVASAPAPETPARPLGPPASYDESGLATRLVAGVADFDVRGLLADRSLSSLLGIALLVVGGYLVLSWIVPGVQVIGSLAILVAGAVLLYVHLARGGSPWMLYAGAALTGMGAARVVGALLPGEWHGTTAIGIGVAFLAIGYLRHSQAGGYGWQGVVGGAAIALGLVQMVLGWLPGTPGLLDLLSPAVLLVVGALLVLGTRWFAGDRPSDRR